MSTTTRVAPTIAYDDRSKELTIQLPRNLPHWTSLLKEIGAKWNSYAKTPFTHTMPAYLINYYSAIDAFPGLEFDESVVEWVSRMESLDSGSVAVSVDDRLFNFQRDSVRYLANNPHPGAILVLSPGLGKSAVSIQAAQVREYENILIISPLSLLRVWEREVETWGKNITAVRAHKEGPLDDKVVVTNYETIVSRLELYLVRRWDLIIIDESVMVKSRSTQRFQALKLLRARARRVWLLSGYPISRYADDLWAQLNIIDPKTFSSYWRFTNRYCHVEQTVWGHKITGTREDRQLMRDLADICYVVNMKDVLDLPAYIPQQIELEFRPDQRKAFDDVKQQFYTLLDSGAIVDTGSKVAQLLRMQQITSNLATVGGHHSSCKTDAIVELMENNGIEFPCLIWVHWQETGENLALKLNKALPDRRIGLINGRNTAQHEEIFESYKSGNSDVLICSMSVGKYGHTLTKTRTIIYHDITWDADAYMQSKDRVRRIGLEQSARLITLKVVGSTDGMVEDNLAGKMPGIAAISNSDLSAILKAL